MRTTSGILHRALCILLCLSLPACAVSRSTVIESGYKLDTIKLCRNYLKDQELIQKHAITEAMETHEIAAVAEKETDEERQYAHVLALQMRVRSLNEASCDQVVDDQNGKIAAGIAVGILAVGAVAAATHNSSNNYAPSPYSGYSNSYAWDQFYGSGESLQWRCRNKTNDQLTSDFNCGGTSRIDTT